jgi:hypothetical protein
MGNRSGFLCLLVAVWSSLLLAMTSSVAAISKLDVPALDEQDLPFYLDKYEHDDDAHVYLYSSLSLISRQRSTAVFELSSSPASGITPLLRLGIHPQLDVSFPPEFFDATIWGQLHNRFQRDFELLAIEREIIRLFKELDDLNAHSMALLGSRLGSLSHAQRPLTLDRRNYLQRSLETPAYHEKGSGEQPQAIEPPEPNSELLSLIRRHESSGQPEQLTAHFAVRAGTSQVPVREGEAWGATSMRVSQAQQAAESTGTSHEGYGVQLLVKLYTLLIRYISQNKIEAMIYLWILLLLSLSVKAVFRRS